MKVLIASGWWCSEKNDNRLTFGDEEVRGKAFFYKWVDSIFRQSIKADVYITDSASPLKPDLNYAIDKNMNIQFVSLNENGGHATNLNGFYCGWTRSIISSLSHFIMCDYDNYVYIEQDALLSENALAKAIEDSIAKGAVFGKSNDTAYKIQASFFVLNRKNALILLKGLLLFKSDDKVISPENKIALSLNRLYIPSLEVLFTFHIGLSTKIINFLSIFSPLRKYSYLTFGAGRDRPINFDENLYYFQQGTREELDVYDEKFK